MGSESLPTSHLYIDDSLVDVYQTSITQIIFDLGRKFSVHLPPQNIDCPNCTYDSVNKRSGNRYTPNSSGTALNISFPLGQICPVCRSIGTLPIYRNFTYTALVRRTPNDLNYEFYGVDPTTVLRLKTVLSTYQDLVDADFVVLDGQKYIKLTAPVLTGLRDNAFVVSLWKASP